MRTLIIMLVVFVLIKLLVPVWDLELDTGKTFCFCYGDGCGVEIQGVIAVRWGPDGFGIGLRPVWNWDDLAVEDGRMCQAVGSGRG